MVCAIPLLHDEIAPIVCSNIKYIDPLTFREIIIFHYFHLSGNVLMTNKCVQNWIKLCVSAVKTVRNVRITQHCNCCFHFA